MHAYHEGLAGYSAEQILHDGCQECEYRGANFGKAIADLDAQNFRRAWQRAAEFGRDGAPDVARVEIALLEGLWGIQVHLERLGWPIGVIPDLKDDLWVDVGHAAESSG